jgi:hypothetical protein
MEPVEHLLAERPPTPSLRVSAVMERVL